MSQHSEQLAEQIRAALRGVPGLPSYSPQVTEAIRVLANSAERRDRQIANGIRQAAAGAGVAPDRVEAVLREVGLVVPEPRVEPTAAPNHVNVAPNEARVNPPRTEGTVDVAALAQTVSELAGQVRTLITAAQRHGVRV